MFPDLLGKLPRVLSASRKPRNRISLLPPTCVPPVSLYGHPSRYHHETPSITSRPVPESLRLPCVYPASPLRPALRPAFLSHHSCVPCHPAFSCVLLHHLASASCILCGLVISRMFRWFLGPERVYSPPCVYLPLCSNHPLPVL